MIPEAFLREYKMIFVSANRPEEMEWFSASRKGSVQVLTTSRVERTGHGDCGPTIYALRHSHARVDCVAVHAAHPPEIDLSISIPPRR